MDLFLRLQFPRLDAKSHSQTEIESHLHLALCCLEDNQQQVHELVDVVKDQSQDIKRLSVQIEILLSMAKEQSQQQERQSQHIQRQSEQIEQQSKQIERLMSKDKKQSEKNDRQKSTGLAQFHRRLMSKDKAQSEKMGSSMSTVQDQTLQRERRGPINQIFPTPFEWRIPNIKAVGKGATIQQQRLVSEQFHLFERGYKYLLTIVMRIHSLQNYPLTSSIDGDLCVYIKVVPGEFDELLSWPCKEKVRVTLVHQDRPRSNSENISRVFDFGEVLRPIPDDHLIFELSRDQLPSYTKDGTILIRVNRENRD